MNANRHHARRPSAITVSDRLRMQRAIAAYDARIASARRVNRLVRLAYLAGAVALAVSLFYAATN